MNNFVVVVFPEESRAADAIRELQRRHQEGSVTVYATAELRREPSGELSIERTRHEGPLGLGVGAMAGGLVGVLGGPLGPLAGIAAGSLAGSVGDTLRTVLRDEVIDDVQRALTAGASALVAEVSEDSTETIDALMRSLGGTVTRQPRGEVAAGFMREDTAAMRTDLQGLSAELAGIKAAQIQTDLDVDLVNAKEKLERTAQQARQRVDHLTQELEAKIEVLKLQADRAEPAIRHRILGRVDEIRADLRRRAEKLRRACELAEEALH